MNWQCSHDGNVFFSSLQVGAQFSNSTSHLPHPPAGPAPMSITTDCDPLMPELRLPLPIVTTQNVNFVTIPSNQLSPTPNRHRPQPVNPLSALASGMQHFPMTIAFHPRQSTVEPSPTHRQIVQECISCTNSTKDFLSPAQFPAPAAHFSVTRTQELSTIGCVSSEADQ